MDEKNKCIRMLRGVYPGLDVELWSERMDDFGSFGFQDMVKAMNYLSLVTDEKREAALIECGLSPKMSDLVVWLKANGVNYDTAINLFWVAAHDVPGYVGEDNFFFMSERPVDKAKYAADLFGLTGLELRVGPANMHELWTFVNSKIEPEAELVCVHEEKVVVEDAVDAIVGQMLTVGAVTEDEADGCRVSLDREVALDDKAAVLGLTYLSAFPLEERMAVYRVLGFSPTAQELLPFVKLKEGSDDVSVRCEWAVTDHSSGGDDGFLGLRICEVPRKLRDKDLAGTLAKHGTRRLGPVKCLAYCRDWGNGDGYCYLDIFQDKYKAVVKEEYGLWPTLVNVVNRGLVDKYDQVALSKTYVHFRGLGAVHFSKSVVSDLTVQSLVNGMLLRDLDKLSAPAYDFVGRMRVGGAVASVLRGFVGEEPQFKVSRVEKGKDPGLDYPVEFELEEDVVVAQGDLMLEQLPVPPGLVVIAMTPRDRLKAEADMDWIDVPVLLMSEVDNNDYKHIWIVRYDSEGADKLCSKFRLTCTVSGATMNYLQGPRVGDFDREIRLWCKSTVVGLGIHEMDVYKDHHDPFVDAEVV